MSASRSPLRILIHLAAAEYHYVIIDTPPALDDHSIAILENSDMVSLSRPWTSRR